MLADQNQFSSCQRRKLVLTWLALPCDDLDQVRVAWLWRFGGACNHEGASQKACMRSSHFCGPVLAEHHQWVSDRDHWCWPSWPCVRPVDLGVGFLRGTPPTSMHGGDVRPPRQQGMLSNGRTSVPAGPNMMSNNGAGLISALACGMIRRASWFGRARAYHQGRTSHHAPGACGPGFC